MRKYVTISKEDQSRVVLDAARNQASPERLKEVLHDEELPQVSSTHLHGYLVDLERGHLAQVATGAAPELVEELAQKIDVVRDVLRERKFTVPDPSTPAAA